MSKISRQLVQAVARIVNDSIPRFAAFRERVGFPDGVLTVQLTTAAGLTAAAMMIAGIGVRAAATVLMAIAVGGIVLIHRHAGWFVAEHGAGNSEHSVALIVLLLVVAAGRPAPRSDRP